MKQLLNGTNVKSSIALFTALLVNTVLWAQDGGGSGSGSGSESSSGSSVSVTRTETTSENWYASPWVWVIGVAVFILLLIALLRGGSSKTVAGRTDRVTVTKTTDTDIV
jgi:hypothetical protein